MNPASVDFGRPIGLFTLSNVGLMPHISQPFHIFEPRYRQMIEQAVEPAGGDLEKALPIAVAMGGRGEPDSVSGIRPVVCVGRITEVEPYPGGRYAVMLHGACRARIDDVEPPDARRGYHRAWLRPLDLAQDQWPPMPEVRRTVRSLLDNPRLRRLGGGELLRQLASHDGIPVSTMLDLVGFLAFTERERRYDLLSHPDCRERAAIVTRELQELDRLVSLVDLQHPNDWPKGLSLN